MIVGQQQDGRLILFKAPGIYKLQSGDPKWADSPWINIGKDVHSVIRHVDGHLEVFTITGRQKPSEHGEVEPDIKIGAAFHNWQNGANGSWHAGGVDWPLLDDDGNEWWEQGLSAAALNRDGHLEIFTRGTNNKLYHKWLTGDGWSDWNGDLGGNLSTEPVVAQNEDGRLEVFALDNNNALVHIWQNGPNAAGGWSSWSSMGGSWSSRPVVGQNGDGRLEIFIAGGIAGSNDLIVYHIPQTAPNNGWGGGIPFNNQSSGSVAVSPAEAPFSAFGTDGFTPPGPVATVAAAQNLDDRLEIFIEGGDGNIYHRWQTSPGGDWSNWATFGNNPIAGHNPVVAKNTDGRLEVFIEDPDGLIHHIWQTSPDNGWSDWFPLP